MESTMKISKFIPTVFRFFALATTVCGGNSDVKQCTVTLEKPWGLHEDCSDRGLTDLPRDLLKTNVTSLDISWNNFSTIRAGMFDGFESLLELDICYNSMDSSWHQLVLDDGAFSGMPSLETLKLSFSLIGALTDGTFGNASTWKHMDLSSNKNLQVSIEAFSELTSLTWLDLQKNNISDVRFLGSSGLVSLRKLYLDHNGIEHLPRYAFRYMSSLTYLSIFDNHLKVLESDVFSGLTSLNELYLGQNMISNISIHAFTGLTSLELLYLDSNDVIQLARGIFSPLVTLKNMVLTSSQIANLSMGAFYGLSSLTDLDISDCGISVIFSRTFVGLDSLRQMDLGENSIDEIESAAFDDLQNLTMLSLGFSSIKNISKDMFQGLSNLVHLFLAGNDLESLPSYVFSELPSLQHLDLSTNSIRNVTADVFVSLGRLTYLDLNSNKIRHLGSRTFSLMPSLACLNLSNNMIRSIAPHTFHGLSDLVELVLQQNKLKIIPDAAFSGMSTLMTLNIRDNKICNISVHALAVLPSLSFLNMLSNKMDRIGDLLTALPNLDKVDVSYNSLKVISSQEVKLLETTTVTQLAAEGNPYNCSCALFDFAKWFYKFRHTLISDDQSQYRCSDSGLPIAEEVLANCHDSSNTLYLIITLPVSVVLLIVVSSSLAYYHRWTIRWNWYRLRYRHYQTLENMADYDPSVEFDAFVAYNNRDLDFVQQQLLPNLENPDDEDPLRLVVDFREFIPGHPLADEIVTYIEKSRKTLLLLSGNFIDSNWTMFEYEMSRSKLARRQDAIVVVLLENISSRLRELPRSLNLLIKEKLYIEWTNSAAGQVVFWKKLKLALRKSPIIRRTEL